METDEKSAAPPHTPSGSPGKNTRLEMLRIVLEFIAKSFYPLIITVLIIILLPKLEQIDLDKLIGRLQSAKVGDSEFTFTQAQDVGAETAPLNSKIAELERAITTLSGEVSHMQPGIASAEISAAGKRAREAAERQYQANAAYTVLVFHRRESRREADAITKALLTAGFVSSDTETDFSELQKIEPRQGVIHITYTSAGSQILSDIKERIAKLGLSVEVAVNNRATDLRRGDLQILVF